QAELAKPQLVLDPCVNKLRHLWTLPIDLFCLFSLHFRDECLYGFRVLAPCNSPASGVGTAFIAKRTGLALRRSSLIPDLDSPDEAVLRRWFQSFSCGTDVVIGGGVIVERFVMKPRSNAPFFIPLRLGRSLRYRRNQIDMSVRRRFDVGVTGVTRVGNHLPGNSQLLFQSIDRRH